MFRDIHPFPPNNGGVVGPFRVEFSAGLAGRDDEYRLRHRIFVLERKWLKTAGVLESDEFDPQSCAFILRDRVTGEPAACQRFILPDRLPHGLVPPVEQLVPGLAALSGPRHAWAEVSRSTVDPQYRWGSRSTEMPAMRAIKYASIALASALERHVLFSVSDPRTAVLTRRMGFEIHQIGDAFDYHGTRAPYRIDMAEVRASVPDELTGLIEALTERARSVVYGTH